jgi:hypothetical protein
MHMPITLEKILSGHVQLWEFDLQIRTSEVLSAES